ncbi:hypothetical protein GSI_11472 [Ganoderma sinense ZZ0214-1]|uniref:Uncharacterized protein n=1 Tax=Ganoderma sinense ZZ0214-1 TaxID=1077348 RepID=A0A2G8RW37_9APHY|nr:hypothetical protein GSI_11472 [Ganoderma sinense ZZ0214-1]
MAPVVLPRKVYKTLAPAVKGCVGVAREVKWHKFLNVFTSYWSCKAEGLKSNIVIVTPPSSSDRWPFHTTPFKLHKPADGRVRWRELQRYRHMFHSKLEWDHRTFVCGREREAT